MLSEAVFRKSPQGVQTIASRERRMAPRLRSLLILVDGKRTYAELARLGAALGEPDALLGQLVDAGLVEAVEPPAAPPPAEAPTEAAPPLPVAPDASAPPPADALALREAEPEEALESEPLAIESTVDGSAPTTWPMEYADDSLLALPDATQDTTPDNGADAAPLPAARSAGRMEPVWVEEAEEPPLIAAWTAPEPDAALVADPPPPEPPPAPKPRARSRRLWRSHQNVPITREALIAVMSLPVSAPAPLSEERPRWPMTPQELDDARDYALRELHNLLGSDAEILAQPIAIAVTSEEMIAAIRRTKVFLRSLRGEALAAQFASMVRANTALP